MNMNFMKISSITFFVITFYKTFIKLRAIFNPFKVLKQANFVTLPIYINDLLPNIEGITILF